MMSPGVCPHVRLVNPPSSRTDEYVGIKLPSSWLIKIAVNDGVDLMSHYQYDKIRDAIISPNGHPIVTYKIQMCEDCGITIFEPCGG